MGTVAPGVDAFARAHEAHPLPVGHKRDDHGRAATDAGGVAHEVVAVVLHDHVVELQAGGLEFLALHGHELLLVHGFAVGVHPGEVARRDCIQARRVLRRDELLESAILSLDGAAAVPGRGERNGGDASERHQSSH